MSDFIKKFLLEDPRRLSANGRYVALAAFGKHPGWDDHVEDLGLETESLNLAKTVLYIKGIGGQIDAGAWEKLEAGQELPAFNHLFVWQRSGQLLLGRMWSSSDGKGRKRYPMVVCLHFIGVTLGWALKQGLPVLAELAQGCAATASASEVRQLLDRKRAALRAAVQSNHSDGEYAPVTPETLHQILHPNGESQPETFLRVLYQAQSQLSTFARGAFSERANAPLHPQQLRVPAAISDPQPALLFWTRFFLTQIDAAAPLLLTLPLDANWVDVTAGEPGSHEFFCLRASPKGMPLVSEVPYNLDAAFRAKAGAFLEGFQRGETAAASLQPAPEKAAPAQGWWRKWLAVGAILALGVVGALLWLKKGETHPAPANPPGAPPVVATPVADVHPAPPAIPPAPQVSPSAAAASAPDATNTSAKGAEAPPAPTNSAIATNSPVKPTN
jgi:hypothetical protein